MNRNQLHALQDSIDKEKIKKANQYIFKYLAIEGFNLFETSFLVASMNDVLKDMKKNDPLRLVKEFDYSSSVDEAFSDNAISNTES